MHVGVARKAVLINSATMGRTRFLEVLAQFHSSAWFGLMILFSNLDQSRIFWIKVGQRLEPEWNQFEIAKFPIVTRTDRLEKYLENLTLTDIEILRNENLPKSVIFKNSPL